MKNTRDRNNQVVVVGCGIIGLSSAIRLREAGYAVRIVAKDLPPCTTSNKAAAVWEPYHVKPPKKAAQWAHVSYRHYAAEYGEPTAGVREIELTKVAKVALEKPFWFRDDYPFRKLAPEELPEGYRSGFAAKVPLIHSATYLEYLLHRFARLGGDLGMRALGRLSDLGFDGHAIVNCSGLGARELVGDGDVFPVRGQLAVVTLDQPLRYVVDDTSHDDPIYVFPRGNECILGGTATAGSFDLQEDRHTREQILERCCALEPALKNSLFVRPVVGLRPGRKKVRLEAEPGTSAPRIIHNYGHGGAGFTVAWGCAEQVVKLVGSDRPGSL